jgi:hypothetical protein
MSRGAGIHQRAILEEIASDGYSVVTAADDSEAVKVARRRAARVLAKAGRVLLTAERVEDETGGRMIAVPVGTTTTHYNRLGRDDRIYRVASG